MAYHLASQVFKVMGLALGDLLHNLATQVLPQTSKVVLFQISRRHQIALIHKQIMQAHLKLWVHQQ